MDREDSDQCFSCGLFGHGVNRCTRLDRSFPFKMPGWSVDVQDGQYRASRICGDEQDLRWGKGGMVRAGGSPSRTISEDNTPDPGGGHQPAWKRPKDDTHGPVGGKGGTSLRHGHKEIYKDLNLKNSTSNPRPHEPTTS